MKDERALPHVAAIPPSDDLSVLIAGYHWERDCIGLSGDAVYRLQGLEEDGDLYLKYALRENALDLGGEMVRLQWLGWHVRVPQIRRFIAAPEEAWLLMTALTGQSAYRSLQTSPDSRAEVVDAIATFLRSLHAIPVESCPFNSDHRLRLGEAKWRLAARLVDVDSFDEEHKGWTPDDVWDAMTALLPFATSEPVVTHGDFSLENIIVTDGMEVGCIDVGRAGIADRYQDIAIIWKSLAEFGPELQNRFLASYGIDEPDTEKIRFHLLLDELF